MEQLMAHHLNKKTKQTTSKTGPCRSPVEGHPEWQAGKDGSSDVLLSGSILSSIKLFFWSLRLHID